LADSRRVVVVLGATQTLAWASSTYLPAILAAPIARDLGLARSTVFLAFSVSLLVMAALGPAAGRAIDRAGGRGTLMLSNLVLAAGLVLLGCAHGPVLLFGAWCVLGAGMALGLYDAAFAALVRLFGTEARKPITGITLIAGFASTVGWPLTAYLDARIGWRGACFVWAALHLLVALPLHWRVIPRVAEAPGAAPSAGGSTDAGARTGAGAGRDESGRDDQAEGLDDASRPRRFALLATYFAATAFVTSAYAAHLPGLLAAMGAGAAGAVLAAALLGPAQVAARLVEFGVISRWNVHALTTARWATALHPVACLLLGLAGGPPTLAAVFALLHGAGNGMITIAKGTLPLALFGAAGYGLTQGWLGVGARIVQAGAPYAFGLTLDSLGPRAALALSGLVSLMALATLLALRAPRR
jgi:MFS family permease